MSIVTTQQTIEIDSVTDVQVTDIVADGSGFVRAIRIYGTPAGTNAPLLFDLRIKSDTLANLDITTPVLTF